MFTILINAKTPMTINTDAAMAIIIPIGFVMKANA